MKFSVGLTLSLFASLAGAQALVDCAPLVPCTTVGPGNTGTGDPAWLAFGKLNSDVLTLWPLLTNSIAAGTNVTLAGSWPGTITINASGGGSPSGATQTVLGNGQTTTTTMVPLTLTGNLVATPSNTLGTTQQLNPNQTNNLCISATTYALVANEAGASLHLCGTAAQTVTVPVTTGSFAAGYSVDLTNDGPFVATLQPTSSSPTINGQVQFPLPAGATCTIT
jgi:hypothetical protein